MSPENREKLDLAVVEIWKNVPFRIYDIVDGWVKPPLIVDMLSLMKTRLFCA